MYADSIFAAYPIIQWALMKENIVCVMQMYVLYSSYPKKVVSRFDGIIVDKERLTPYK